MTYVVYLDFAATAAIRPPEVADAVAAYLRDVGATPGRSTHARSLRAGRMVLQCRQRLAEFFGIAGDPGRIAFQMNATHALNSALHGVLRPGDTVIRTVLDHNSVRRPVAALTEFGVEQRILGCDPSGAFDLAELDTLLTEEAGRVKLLALPHASNVLGNVLPVREMADRAHEAGAIVLLDAAQSAGHHRVPVDALGIDLLAFTGHKGLLGPQGTGGLWVREGIAVGPLLRGGTGGDSSTLDMPAGLPDRLEAGTQNAPGIAGLLAALEWLLKQGPDRVREGEAAMKRRLLEGLRTIPGVRIHSPDAPESVGIVTLSLDGWTAGGLSVEMDRRYAVQGRAGLHCAPEAHAVLGTLETGAYRLSVGWDTGPQDIDRATEALRALSLENENKGS